MKAFRTVIGLLLLPFAIQAQNPTITTPSPLPNGTVGSFYQISVTATGLGPSQTWSITTGSLPPGLTLDASKGVISGTPTTAGSSYRFTVQVVDTMDHVASKTFLQTIDPAPPPNITTTSPLPTGTVGVAYSTTLTAASGTPPFSWTLTTQSGPLPPGLTLSATQGIISGTPARAGTFNIIIQVIDQLQNAVAKPFALTIVPPAIAITTSSPLPNGAVGSAYSITLAAANATPPVAWSITQGGVPPGLALDRNQGVISGTPTVGGTYNFTVQVVDSAKSVATTAFALRISTPITFSTSSLPNGTVGVGYSQTLAAAGGNPPYTFMAASTPFAPANLPPGLTLGQQGALSGTPTTAGTFSFTVIATDSTGGTGAQPFTVKIAAPLSITTNASLPSGTIGVAYSQAIAATGGAPPYQFTARGALPPGLSFSPGGSLTGTPTTAGNYSFTVVATDGGQLTTTKDFQIAILNYVPSLQVFPPSLSFTGSAAGDAPGSQTLTILSTSVQPVGFSLRSDGGAPGIASPGWLRVLPTSGMTPGRITVSVDPSGLAARSYSARILVSVPNDSTQAPIIVAVNFVVSDTPPVLALSPLSLRLAARVQAPGIQDQTIVVQNAGGGPLAFNVSIPNPVSWLVSVTPSTGQALPNAPVYVRVRVNTQGLAAGGYKTTVRFVSGGNPIDVPVSLFVSSPGAILAVDGTGLLFQGRQGSGVATPETVTIFNSGDPASTVNWKAEIVKGGLWLSLSSGNGTATAANPGILTLTTNVTANSLAAGGYYALVRITDPQALNSPQYVPVVLNIADPATATQPDPIPEGLVFLATAGGAAPAAQQVRGYASSATAVGFQASAITSDGAGWLSVGPSSGVSSTANPPNLTVSVNLSGLPAGVYTGEVNVSIGTELRSVNVTLIVVPRAPSSNGQSAPLAAGCSPTRMVLTHNGLTNNFTVPAGWPENVAVQLNDDCGNAVPNAAVVASFSNGDQALSLKASPPAGQYGATWQPGKVTPQTTIMVRATSGTLAPATAQITGGVAPNTAPVLGKGGTINVFFEVGGGLSPGALVEVFGAGLASTTTSPGALPLPTSFNGTSVLIGAMEAPLIFLSSGQVNVQIPSELRAPGQYNIIASANAALTLPDTLDLNPVQPGIAHFSDGGTIRTSAQHLDANATLVDTDHPAHPGEVLTIYLVGMGATNPAVPSGQGSPASTLATVSVAPAVTIDGKNTDILFAGLTPGFVGLYQINLRVPNDARSGDLDLVVTQSGAVGNITELRVAP